MNGRKDHLLLNSSPIANGTSVSVRSCAYASGLSRADGLLEEVERARRHPLAVAGGLGDRKPVVPVDAERDPRADRLADPGRPLGRDCERFAGLEHVRVVGGCAIGGSVGDRGRGPCAVGRARCAGHAGEEPDRLPALCDQAADVVEERRAHRCAGGREQWDEVALLPAQKLVDGDAEGLAADVVQRDVDRRLRRGQDPAAFEILAAVEALPDRATGHRIGTDEEVPVVADRRRDGFLTCRETRLAPAHDANVGRYPDEALRADPDHRDVRPDVGDPHAAPPSGRVAYTLTARAA